MEEWFSYDGLMRLTKASRRVLPSGGSTQTMTAAYDKLGNITSRDGQNYTYSSRPHAVTSALDNTYTYNNNGALTGVTGNKTVSVSWKPFNQPNTITQGSQVSTFRYGADHQRVLHSKSATNSIIYIGRGWEREHNGGTITDSFFVFTPLGRSVEVVYVNGAFSTTRYFFTDHLGSVDTVVTGTAFGSPERLSYDAWGVRRATDWQAGSVTTTTRRGYTDHEMLDGLGLVHMNGRIYDSALGRFLSPDPINQDIYHTQTNNAYSYVFNNPLSLTDPTGMEAEGIYRLPDITVGVNGRGGVYSPAFQWNPGVSPLTALPIILRQNSTNNSFTTAYNSLGGPPAVNSSYFMWRDARLVSDADADTDTDTDTDQTILDNIPLKRVAYIKESRLMIIIINGENGEIENGRHRVDPNLVHHWPKLVTQLQDRLVAEGLIQPHQLQLRVATVDSEMG